MICDNCAWRDGCEEREHKGKHEGECEGFFNDYTDPKNRKPKQLRTPEDRKPDLETRG